MERDLGDFASLVALIARLRAPDGCPWDRQQTHASIKPYLIEEAYEVLQAIEDEDSDKLREELGDLLLQIVLHAQMSAEAGEFTIADVVRSINTKLIRRHPHVFGEGKAADEREVALHWEELKQNEREEGASLLSSVPRAMPSLAYSQAIQRRAAAVGFDWKEFGGILEKLTEELAELERAKSVPQRTQELGDILFALANAARWLGVDVEEALSRANDKFSQRFRYMEEECRRRGVGLHQLSFEEQNALWEEAKRRLKS